jgi:hypothetical protein
MILTPRHHERKTIHDALQTVEFLGRSQAGKQLLKHYPRDAHGRVFGDKTAKGRRHLRFCLSTPPTTERQRENGRIQEDHRFLRARL